MRINKLILSILIVIALTFTVSASSCFFKTYNESCERIDTGLNEFQLDDLSSNSQFVKYQVLIYNKENPENQLKLELNEFNIDQISPFLESGVYIINVKAYLRTDEYVKKEFEFIYDNTDIIPPVIPVNLKTDYTIMTLNGFSTPGLEVSAEYNGLTKTVTVDENGEFSMQLDSLIEDNINYVKFYTFDKNRNKKSQIVERVIETENYETKSNNDVTSISIDDLAILNENTVFENGAAYTTKRNFYVQGSITSSSAEEGKVVFVNGQKVIAKSKGKFGAFTILNDGLNKILIESGNIVKTYTVYYLELNFQFTNFDFPKFVTQSKVEITGESNFDYNFQVYLNGNFVNEYTSINKAFDVTILDLVPGKNFVEFRGINNEYYNFIIYYDSEAPTAEFVSSSKLSSASKLVFDIEDDLGINLDSVKLSVDGKEFSGEYLEIRDNLYSFDISSLDEGDYSYIINGEDLVGKTFSLTGSFNVNSANTVIDDIYFDGSLIGNRMFVGYGEETFSIIPSQNIAFKSIFLDGVEQTNYEILKSGKIRLTMDITKAKGNLSFTFINKEYAEFSQNFVYYSDNEEPEVFLDYIQKPFSTGKVRISGEIKDSNFDWSSLSFNRQNNYVRYGNYFEALIDLDNLGQQNLEITGYDYSKNSFTKNLGSILFKDNTNSELVGNKDQDLISNGFEGTLYDSDETIGNYNFVRNYEGFTFNKLYLSSDGFNLPISDIYGVRSLNLNGFEASGNLFNSNEIFEVEQTNSFNSANIDEDLSIYFMGLDSKTKLKKGVIQGFVKTDELKKVNVNDGSCQVYDNSFVCIVSLSNGGNDFKVNVEDVSGNVNSKSLTIEKVYSNLNIDIKDIFGNGIVDNNGAYYMIGDNVNIDAILSNKADISILIDGQEYFKGSRTDDFKVDISSDLEDETKATESKEINLQLKAEDENGFETFSDIVKVVYKRIFESLATVIVN